MVSGHSYLPNDGEFGIIESASRRNAHIYSSDEWVEIIKNAKRKEPLFVVGNMKISDFLSTVALEKAITNRKKTSCGYNFNWLNIRWLRYARNCPLQFQFKETLRPEAAFYSVDLRKQKAGRPVNLNNIHQDPLYRSRRPVKIAKKKDMLDLLPYIPPIYHQFYQNLPIDIPNDARTTIAENSDDEFLYL